MIWKDIPRYEELYQVSNTGIVKRLVSYVACGYKGRGQRKVPESIINPYIGTDGYPYVLISKDDKTKHFAIHRLLAILFIPNPNNYPEVNHIDFDRTNFSLKNIEWVSPKQNISHSREAGRIKIMGHGEANHQAKLTMDQVKEIRELNIPHSKIAPLYGVTRSAISAIKRGDRWKCA